MKVIDTGIPGLIVVEPKIFGDERGFFLETWSKARYEDAGIPSDFCQDNMSFSRKGILRGLHMQNPNSQGKLVSVVQGEVYDVAVDLRVGSPTYRKWYGIVLTDKTRNQMFVPKGFAHGFCVVSETALFSYKVNDIYNPKGEMSVRWDDPELNIDWPVKNPELSAKDAAATFLKDIPETALVRFGDY